MDHNSDKELTWLDQENFIRMERYGVDLLLRTHHLVKIRLMNGRMAGASFNARTTANASSAVC
jgi:hypothetical protein